MDLGEAGATADEGATAVSESAAPSRDIRKTGIDPNFWYPLARSAEVKQGKAFACAFARIADAFTNATSTAFRRPLASRSTS